MSPDSSFDRFVVVDWSARNAPAKGADSIWIAELGSGDVALSNPATRWSALEQLDRILDDCRSERVLIGFDASLGYPSGTARSLGLGGTPWEATWQLITELSVDDRHNRNNRFDVAAQLNRRFGHPAGPFWGCPAKQARPDLASTKPARFELDEFRAVERHLRLAGRRPASAWQLLGAGSVGGQMLTLLPHLAEFRKRRRETVEVWPFTTGLTAPAATGGVVVVAEVWPTMFTGIRDEQIVKDADQVRSTALALREAEDSGRLATWMAPECSDEEARRVVAEEGWILGVAAGAHLR